MHYFKITYKGDGAGNLETFEGFGNDFEEVLQQALSYWNRNAIAYPVQRRHIVKIERGDNVRVFPKRNRSVWFRKFLPQRS